MANPPVPMEVKVLSDKENPFLDRREVLFEVEHHGTATPSLKDVRAKLAVTLKANAELLIVKNYKASYGKSSTRGFVTIYKKKEDLKLELPQYIKRQFEEKKKEGEAKEGEKPASGGAK